MRKTKVICTLGPSTDDEKILEKLILNDMDAARFNMSHNTHEIHRQRARLIKNFRKKHNKYCALLLDTKGPEIRLGNMSKKIVLSCGDEFILTSADVVGNEKICSVSYKELPKKVFPGNFILINDGLVKLKVQEINENNIKCIVINGGEISSKKGINIPDVKLDLPFISPDDLEDLYFAIDEDFDYIAASFTRSAKDILDLKIELNKYKENNIKIIAKIENREGVENIDEILAISDGVMIARGDLGVEIPFEDIPIIQKEIIKKAYTKGKLVITATQMLESMIKNPQPTRAETTDVANAVLDGTSALMLSGETAAGVYPVEALKTMNKIVERIENSDIYEKSFMKTNFDFGFEITPSIAYAACMTAKNLGASAILTASKTGYTARALSGFRPLIKIICGTPNEKVCYQLNANWGIKSMLIDETSDTDELFDKIIYSAKKNGYIKENDIAVICSGTPLGFTADTNTIKIIKI